jgi:hypothetical protein
MPSADPRPPSDRVRVRTPHLTTLADALTARDHVFEVVAADVLVVEAVAPDDLGWLVAAAGVVVYEMAPVRES